ncbi:hypothetical protein CONLIGDRAFT_625088 [Coniochaeta ligniaria NRRL 30616]|uniref:Ipa protein n=1 Tax=Coniochaeta ligniaria NRRL 30616 TaxID=1408157 RepID=A0A1J7J2A8_9PEZI|nr:hypothetical protein CONLIGDRAFT_625088 [Coniochaeta ligniaria NRRL 30616]
MADTYEVLRDLHNDLKHKYKQHGPALTSFWRSFDSRQRARCIKAGAVEGGVLKHRNDTALGNVCKFMPEWNLRDLTESNSDSLLDILKHRATHTLGEQYAQGVDGGLGDYALIDAMMRMRNLRHVDPYTNEMTLFFDDDKYGICYKGLVKDAFAGLEPAMRAGLLLPRSTGELILIRQTYLMQVLNIVIEDILDEGSKTRDRKNRPKKDDATTLTTAVSTLAIKPAKASLPDILATTKDQASALEQYLGLLSSEPVVLVHDVNTWFFSQPGMVPDEKGRTLPSHTDRFISAAVFDAVHNAVRSAAFWNYIVRLLDILDTTTDKAYRALLLQELANITDLEYKRAQSILKHYIQAGTGIKCFRRVSNVHDKAGNPRVILKKHPEELTRADPQLHYILRLCQPETTPSSASDWIKKLAELHDSHPAEREKLAEKEADALSDLAVIIAFAHELSPILAMPPFSRKKGQLFVSRAQDMEAELRPVKDALDLRDFAVPIDNLLEPGMAGGAMAALDKFVADRTGTTLGFMYQDLIEESLSDLQRQHQAIQDSLSLTKPNIPTSIPPPPEPPTREQQLEHRRQKQKTRPPHSSIFNISPRQEGPTAAASEKPQILQVSAPTGAVFSTLFDRSEARGSVSWTSFVAAMTELGFSVVPRYGSVYTFFAPEGMAVRRPLTVHRPHGAGFGGYSALVLARRLERVYGWGRGGFCVG